jgi:hypothetical protein
MKVESRSRKASFVPVSARIRPSLVGLSHCFVHVQNRVSLGPHSGFMVLEAVHEKESLSVQAIHGLPA